MKKYARLRQECSEFDNALYDATPEGSFTDQPRAPAAAASGGSASPARVSQTGLTGLASALKKLGSFREVTGAARRHGDSGHGADEGSRSASESGRWANAETASLSGRWGSVSTNEHWDEATQSSFRDSLSLSRSGRLIPDPEPWTAPKPAHPSSQPAAVQQNISMRETQGWLASVRRPLPPRRPSDDPTEFNWRAATSTTSTKAPPATISQSMRYDRLKTIDLVEDPSYEACPSVMQKAASMREGGAHSDAIMAMARAYSEKHGVPQAILECVACGRGLGVIVQGNPARDTSFCQACRPHAIGAWTYHAKNPESGKSKRKSMMHFCKKILRMGKKANKSKG